MEGQRSFRGFRSRNESKLPNVTVNIRKYQPEVYNSETSKNLKKLYSIALFELLLETYILRWSDEYFRRTEVTSILQFSKPCFIGELLAFMLLQRPGFDCPTLPALASIFANLCNCYTVNLHKPKITSAFVLLAPVFSSSGNLNQNYEGGRLKVRNLDICIFAL